MEPKVELEIRFWRDVVAVLARPRSLQEDLQHMAEIVARHFAAEACGIYLLDRRTDELVLQGAVGSGLREGRMRIGQGITGMSAFQGKALHVSHMQGDPRSHLPRDGEFLYQSIAAVPFEDGGELVGIFNLQTRDVRQFSNSEMKVLTEVVPQALEALIGVVRHQEVSRQRTEDVQALNELGQAINAGLGLDETLELIATRALEVFNAKGSAIRLMVEDALALATMAAAEDAHFDSHYEKRIAEYVAATGEPIMIDDVRTDQNPQDLGSSMVCVPLVLEDRVVGTLSLFDKIAPIGTRRRLFGMDDLNMLFALSSQIAAEIEDIRLANRLQELVRTEKQQGVQLRRLYNHSRALLESITDGLLAVDLEGRVEELNTVARRLLGMEEEEVRGQNIDALVEDKPTLRQWIASGGQFSNRVITLCAPDGKIAAMANLQPIADAAGQSSGAVLTFREMGEVGRLVNRVIGVQRTFAFDDIIGQSAVIEKTKELARVAAGSGANILIQGETGTGKEVFAQAIHNISAFGEGPFLAVNCAAMPRDLIESELFGYVEGAFTGASKKGRLGKFELASGGTLFLDEIGDIPLEVQVKLLRVLQEKTIVRVGGDRTIPINCRVISATNRDLYQAVEEQKFRRDLLYRLNVITIEVPPLREREGDLPLFVDLFVRNFAEHNAKLVHGVDEEVVEIMLKYTWPGNVRELENALEHAVVVAKERQIHREDLPANLQNMRRDTDAKTANEAGQNTLERVQLNYERSARQLYVEALRAEGGDVERAARRLGMSRATFYRRLKKYGLRRNLNYDALIL